MRQIYLTILLGVFTILFTPIFAQNGANLSIQGVLRTSEGTAVSNGEYDLTFRIYNVASGGTALWTETQNNINVKGGIYSVILGAVEPLTISFSERYYLGVSVGGGSELIPRAQLTSSPYALALIGDSNKFPSNGNVGIGDDNPQQKLSLKTYRTSSYNFGINIENDCYFNTYMAARAYDMYFNLSAGDKSYGFALGGDRVLRIHSGGLSVTGRTGHDSKIAFGSQGNIGFPNGQNYLEVKANDANGKILLNANEVNITGKTVFDGLLDLKSNGKAMSLLGTDHTYMELHRGGGRVGIFGYLSPNNNTLELKNETSGGNINIESTGGGDINMNSKLKAKNGLDVDGGLTVYSGNLTAHGPVKFKAEYWESGLASTDYFSESGGIQHWHSSNGDSREDFSLSCDGRIKALEFQAVSDKRIKTNMKKTNSADDLSTLKKIEVTDYDHIDQVTNGKKRKKGVIAQQIKAIYPEAVSLSKDWIPSIYDRPEAVTHASNQTTMSMSKPHGLKVGDKLRIITKKEEKIVNVQTIISPTEFIVDQNMNESKENLFVYGTEIEDFHSVDYDRLFTLAISALQEVNRKVEVLEAENTQLKSTISASTDNNEDLKAELTNLNTRLKKLENLLEMTGSK